MVQVFIFWLPFLSPPSPSPPFTPPTPLVVLFLPPVYRSTRIRYMWGLFSWLLKAGRERVGGTRLRMEVFLFHWRGPKKSLVQTLSGFFGII